MKQREKRIDEGKEAYETDEKTRGEEGRGARDKEKVTKRKQVNEAQGT